MHRGHLPDSAHSDIARLIDAGLNGEHARQIDLVDLLVAAFDFPADLQLAAFQTSMEFTREANG